MDLHQKQIDKDAMKRADELRTEILPKYLEKTNCFNYEVDWLGMSGQNMEAYDNYIMSLVVDVYKVYKSRFQQLLCTSVLLQNCRIL